MALKQHMSTLEIVFIRGFGTSTQGDGRLSRRELGILPAMFDMRQQGCSSVPGASITPLTFVLCWMKLHEGLNAMNV
ncbi:hypothetical protein KCP69_24940 [Salmonella enterica subsp. enterica]|nr:hypothetical protein KCP69_24940 [Salmonella enterica subsp. enterica]